MRHRILFVLFIAAFTAPAFALTDVDRLWIGVCRQESEEDPREYNASEKAAGIAQIRPINLRDCNRIAGYERWILDDRYDPVKSRQMFDVYTRRYARPWSLEAAARVWNGGPNGEFKASTVAYWAEVRSKMPPEPRKREAIPARKARRQPVRLPVLLKQAAGNDTPLPTSRPQGGVQTPSTRPFSRDITYSTADPAEALRLTLCQKDRWLLLSLLFVLIVLAIEGSLLVRGMYWLKRFGVPDCHE